MSTSHAADAVLADVVTAPRRRKEYQAAGYWRSETLADRLAEHARTRADRLAVVDVGGSREKTYRELHADVCRAKAMLQGLGLSRGDVVAVQLPNWYETVVIDLAVLAIGAVLNTMLPIYRGKELRHMLGTARTKVLVTPHQYRRFDHAALAAELTGELPTLAAHVVVADPSADPEAFDRLLADFPPEPYDSGRDAEAVSELLFTSGTEAIPKAIMHTEATANFGVRAAAQCLGVTPTDVVWMPSPIGHSTGFNYGVRMAIHLGATLCLQDQWNAADAVALIVAHRCSYTVAATTFLSDLLQETRRTGADLSSMRLFSSGGAAIPPALVEQAGDLGITVLRLYGATEFLVGTWNRPDSPVQKRTHTDGAPLPGVELEVRDDDGRRLVDTPGEIFVRSPSGCVGFFADPERTGLTFSETGWIASGDLGVMDDAGYLTIVGRKKEIIIRGGLNVAPREIEELVQALPEVAACAVIPLPHERLGEVACACVVLQSGETLTLQGLVAALKSQGVASFKLPERLELFAELPATVTGKVQKHVLVDQVLSRLADPLPGS